MYIFVSRSEYENSEYHELAQGNSLCPKCSASLLTRQLFQWQVRLFDVSPTSSGPYFMLPDLSPNTKSSRQTSIPKSARQNWKKFICFKIISIHDHKAVLLSFGDHSYFCFHHQHMLKRYFLCFQQMKIFQVHIHVYSKPLHKKRCGNLFSQQCCAVSEIH